MDREMKDNKELRELPREVEVAEDTGVLKKGMLLEYNDEKYVYEYFNKIEESGADFHSSSNQFITVSVPTILDLIDKERITYDCEPQDESCDPVQLDGPTIDFYNLINRIERLEKQLESLMGPSDAKEKR